MEKLQIVKKAYKIDFDKIEEGFLASEQWCHAENKNKAKSKLLSEVIYEEWKLKWGDKPIDYLTIPVVRVKGYDIVVFEGVEVRRYEIDRILAEKERNRELDKILNNESVKFCYIVKHGSFYKPNSCGYTSFQSRAGVYEKEHAVKDAKMCSDLWVRPIDIEEHNRIINSEIENLKKNLIKV